MSSSDKIILSFTIIVTLAILSVIGMYSYTKYNTDIAAIKQGLHQTQTSRGNIIWVK